MIKEEAPNCNAAEKDLKFGIKLFNVSLKVFVPKKYIREIINEAVCPITVARAAPLIPHFAPNINTGSSIMFIIAPANIEAIDTEGLPSARITAFIIFESINKGKNARIMLKYSIAYPMLFSDAPNKVKICSLSG